MVMTLNYLTSWKWKSESFYFLRIDGDNTPIIRGSALGALNKEPKWVELKSWN